MKRWVTCLSLVGVLAAPAGWAASSDKTAEEKQQAGQEQVRDGAMEKAERSVKAQSTPVGKGSAHPVVVVSETVFVDLSNLPMSLTDDGIEHFKDRNFGAAGNDFVSAGRIMMIQAKRTEDKDMRKEMTQAGETLSDLGEKVSEGKIKTQKELDKELAQVAYHRARFHRLQAIEEWNDKEARKAAHDLASAADAIERGIKWTGEEMAKGTKATLEGARKLSGKVLEGSGWTVAEVGKAIDDVGTEVKSLGERLDQKEVAH